MINPSYQLAGEIYIHAASAAVWDRFCQLSNWPRWNERVLAAHWLQGEPWQEGSVFELAVRSPLGLTVTSQSVVRMCVPGNTVVWETQQLGMTVVNTAQFRDEVGGCKLTGRHVYYGVPTLLLRFLRSGQEAALAVAMRALKILVEGSPR